MSKLQPMIKDPPAPGAVRRAVPDALPPQLCATATQAPDGAGWLTEIKFDGYRLIAAMEGGAVRLLTRNGHDWADRLPAVRAAFAALPVQSAVFDGELVALDAAGVSSFPALQAALKAGRDRSLHFYAFDLLHLAGWDLRTCALRDRKNLLAAAIPATGLIRYSAHHEGQAAELHRNACGMGLEGVICKRADAPYRAGRSGDWLKLKCGGREELVVLGWTPPGGSRVGIGALHLGYHDPDGGLHYAGAVGTGFSDDELRRLRKVLGAIQDGPPEGLLTAGDPIDPAITWVRPELVAEIKFTGWSGAGRVRHGVYLGLRGDKPATEVVRPTADPAAARSFFDPRPPRRPRLARPRGAIPPRRTDRTSE